MAKFRYYITDIFDGIIKGTNESDVAKQFSNVEEFFVVDSETGKHLAYGEGVDIKDIESDENSEDDD